MKIQHLAIIIMTISTITSAIAETKLKPYTIASIQQDKIIPELKANGFNIAGSYSPYQGLKIIAVTSKSLKNNAAKSDKGGYGAVIRIAITDKMVSYTTPAYWANAYQLKSNLQDITALLDKILGNRGTFGSEKGISTKKLRKYKYMAFMPEFNDQIKLASFSSYKDAVSKIESSLTKKENGLIKVYRIDIPGKEETVFGINIDGNNSTTDKSIMDVLNKFTGEPEHGAFLPYEVLVSGNSVYMLHGKFRIALSFPDLSMGQFMKIRNAPADIESAFKKLIK